MRIASLVFIVLGCSTGFYAAYRWKRASSGIIDIGEEESGERETVHEQWIGAIMNSITESANLNRTAAFWTAISVGFGAIGGVLGILAGWIR